MSLHYVYIAALTAVFIVTDWSQVSADGCRMMEYTDHYEAMCTGNPSTFAKEASAVPAVPSVLPPSSANVATALPTRVSSVQTTISVPSSKPLEAESNESTPQRATYGGNRSRRHDAETMYSVKTSRNDLIANTRP